MYNMWEDGPKWEALVRKNGKGQAISDLSFTSRKVREELEKEANKCLVPFIVKRMPTGC